MTTLQEMLSRRQLARLALVTWGSAWGLRASPSVAAPCTNELRVSTAGWRTDFSRSTICLEEILPGGPGKDGIPPIDRPVAISIEEAATWLESREPVIAIERNGQARAYPLQILVWHEIVNDELGGEPTLVTFCPLCNTAIAFDRRLEPAGPVYDFGTTGNLRFSDLVMWDRQTESWWQQLTGEAIVGERAGKRLAPYPAQILGWQAFADAYPNGDVLSRNTGQNRPYGTNPYVGYDDIDSSPFLFDGTPDGRLRPMERVVGVTHEGEAVAYPLGDISSARVIHDTIGTLPIVVLIAPGARSATDAATIAASRDVGQVGVFDRRLSDFLFTFEIGGPDEFQDTQTGTRWDVTGQGVAGPLAGRRLLAVPHVVAFWFSWAAGFPQTRLWAG